VFTGLWRPWSIISEVHPGEAIYRFIFEIHHKHVPSLSRRSIFLGSIRFTCPRTHVGVYPTPYVGSVNADELTIDFRTLRP